MSSKLSSAAAVDAVIRLRLSPAVVPFGLRPVVPGSRLQGPALPVTHLGSVDVLLEMIELGEPGDVLVVDNGARNDEACVGDLICLEAKLAGLAGIVIWGYHRDTAQLAEIGLPVFSLGAFPRGPVRIPPAGPAMRTATVGGITVHPGDLVVADDDGVVLLDASSSEQVSSVAAEIIRVEEAQSERMLAGTSLREQLGFAEYLQLRAANPGYSLRDHLNARGGAIET